MEIIRELTIIEDEIAGCPYCGDALAMITRLLPIGYGKSIYDLYLKANLSKCISCSKFFITETEYLMVLEEISEIGDLKASLEFLETKITKEDNIIINNQPSNLEKINDDEKNLSNDNLSNSIVKRALIIDGQICPICQNHLSNHKAEILVWDGFNRNVEVKSLHCKKCEMDYFEEITIKQLKRKFGERVIPGYDLPNSLINERPDVMYKFVYSVDVEFKYIDLFKSSRHYFKLYSVDLVVEGEAVSYVLNNFDKSITKSIIYAYNKNELSIFDDELGRNINRAITSKERNFVFNNKKYEFVQIVSLPNKKTLYENIKPLKRYERLDSKGDINKPILPSDVITKKPVKYEELPKQNKMINKRNNQFFRVILKNEESVQSKYVITDEFDKDIAQSNLLSNNELSYAVHPLAMHIILSKYNNKTRFMCNGVDYEIIDFILINERKKTLIDAYNYIVTHTEMNDELIYSYVDNFSQNRINYNSESSNYNYFNTLNPSSMFSLEGYSVGENGPSVEHRRKILMNIIKMRKKSKVEVLSFLKWNIETKPHFVDACSEWKSDYDYILYNAR